MRYYCHVISLVGSTLVASILFQIAVFIRDYGYVEEIRHDCERTEGD